MDFYTTHDFFFFQAEDGIRDLTVTGVQTCALPISVLARISKKWNDRCDPIRTGPPRRVHHDEQLHQVLVSGRAGRLNDENIVAPNVFLDLDVSLAIWERADCCLTEWHSDVFANALGQLAVGRAAEDF